MCQLLGMNCNTPTDINFSFTGFSQRAGNTDHHSDGWGIAFFEEGGLRHLVDHHPATQGRVLLQNCHPFVRELWGKNWVFAHNGDLKDFRPRLHAHFRPVGDTDSEHVFCWIMQELWKSHAGTPSIAELTHTLRDLAARIAPHGTFNFLLCNGDALWAHATTFLCYTERAHPFSHAHLSDEDLSLDFSTCTTPQDRVAVVVTTPLTTNEEWTHFQPGELMVFDQGRRLLL